MEQQPAIDGPDCRNVARSHRAHLALLLSGGGARAAYQVGFLRFLATQFPDFSPDVLTGVSAGAINAAYLAAHPGSFRERVDALANLWANLRIEDVFRVDLLCLARNVARWGLRLLSGGSRRAPRARSLVDTQPLRALLARVLDAENGILTGVDRNIGDGSLKAIALTASSYATGQSVTWVRGCEIESWERPDRKSIKGPLTVEQVMASSALPLLFPAVQVDGAWYGDGGVRLTAPLSGRIASEYEPQLPPAFRFLTRGLGTREMRSSSMLSLVMFQPDYLKRLLDLGEADARARASELGALLKAA